MIVTIDGPAGAGKSTAARQLAERLGFQFLDTGATYRAVALAAKRRQVDWEDPAQIVQVAHSVDIELADDRVLLDGEDVSDAIRTAAVTSLIHYAANNPGVRTRMVELQREMAAGKDMVTEGRDQGTVVFPDAECKIFLTASAEERARRRHEELQKRGEEISFEQVLADQQQRDERDSNRAAGPLKQADDAILVNTDGLTLGQAVDRLEEVVRAKLSLS